MNLERIDAKIQDIHDQIEYLNDAESVNTVAVGSRAETRTAQLAMQRERVLILEKLRTMTEPEALEYAQTMLLEYAQQPTESKRLELELIGYAVSDNADHLLTLFMKLERG